MMPLAADSLLDRIRLKASLNRWRLIALVAGALFFIVLLGKTALIPASLGGRDYIAHITIKDIILEDRERDKALEDLQKDPSVKAVVMHINSPGGTIVGGESLYYSLRSLAEKKPLVATLGSLAASGGYMAAIAADHIFTYQGTITGSIGVMLQTAELTQLSEKIGVKFLTFKSGPLKGTPSPFERTSPEAEKAIQDSINDAYDLFIDMVTERRKLSRTKILSLADGRIYTGRQAVTHKLVDAIGSEKEALLWLKNKRGIDTLSLPLKEVELKPQKFDFERIFSTLYKGDNIISSLLAPKGLIVEWKPNLF